MSSALFLILVGIPLLWHAGLTVATYYDSQRVGMDPRRWTWIVFLVPLFGFFLYLFERSELFYDPETDPYTEGGFNVHESRAPENRPEDE